MKSKNIYSISCYSNTIKRCIVDVKNEWLHISDTVLYPIHMEQPDWYPAFDFAPEQASVTKHKLLNRAAAEKVMVFAFHFPFPCLGYVIEKGKGWHWQPI